MYLLISLVFVKNDFLYKKKNMTLHYIILYENPNRVILSYFKNVILNKASDDLYLPLIEKVNDLYLNPNCSPVLIICSVVNDCIC